ncbi:MAG: molybdate ABC transporter permease subunit [Phycisphaerales bacterium]
MHTLPGSFELEALWLSLKVATWCVVVSLVPGIWLGHVLARRTFPGKMLLDALIHVPLVIPPVVTGYLLLRLLGRGSGLGAWLHDTLGINIVFNWKAAVLASAVMAFPLLVRSVRLSIEAIDPHLDEAARTLGMSPARRFLRITLPLALPGVVAGALLAFARSLGEFGATITVAGNIPGQTQTLPLAIYQAMQQPGGESAATRLVIISIVLALLSVILSEVLARRVTRWQGTRPA